MFFKKLLEICTYQTIDKGKGKEYIMGVLEQNKPNRTCTRIQQQSINKFTCTTLKCTIAQMHTYTNTY